MLSFHAYESSWLCARGSGCHEQYFGSACHWEHFHMLIRINNSCSVICLMFFPSLFFSRGQNGWEMMLPWREGQAICILSPWRAWWAWVSTAEDVEDDWGRLGSNASLSFREPFMLCAGSWAAAGSWSVCTGNTLCCSAFLLHLTFHSDCLKLDALWFSGLCWVWIKPSWEKGLAGHKAFLI